MDWSDTWRGAFRIELRAEVIGLAWRGWPVIPGTFPTAGAWHGAGDEPAAALAPIHPDWAERIGIRPEAVGAWWSQAPYSLLVATGQVLDAVEVDARTGRRIAVMLRAAGAPSPIVATPQGQWYFLTEPGGVLGELSENETVRVHTQGSWIPLPPTPFQHGIVHWRVKPDICGWKLPSADLVQRAALKVLDGQSPAALLEQELVAL